MSMAPHQTIPHELAVALRVLVDESIGDNIYGVRDREGMGWNGPRVTAYSKACAMIEQFAAPKGSVPLEETADQKRLRELRAQQSQVAAEISKLEGDLQR